MSCESNESGDAKAAKLSGSFKSSFGNVTFVSRSIGRPISVRRVLFSFEARNSSKLENEIEICQNLASAKIVEEREFVSARRK
jgi:hypothetical protein